MSQEGGGKELVIAWAEFFFPPGLLPTVRNHGKVSHFRICKSPRGSLYIQKGRPFPNMEELLAFYTENWKVIQSPLLQPCSPAVCTPTVWPGQKKRKDKLRKNRNN